MLPSLVDDHLNSHSASSFEEPVLNSGLKDVAYAAIASVDHKDGIVKSSKHTTLLDIVGRSCNSGSGSDKDVDVNLVTRRANAKFVFWWHVSWRTAHRDLRLIRQLSKIAGASWDNFIKSMMKIIFSEAICMMETCDMDIH
ncbi:hypothetical protein Tco_0886520, partial [Tanacetum coccineum]